MSAVAALAKAARPSPHPPFGHPAPRPSHPLARGGAMDGRSDASAVSPFAPEGEGTATATAFAARRPRLNPLLRPQEVPVGRKPLPSAFGLGTCVSNVDHQAPLYCFNTTGSADAVIAFSLLTFFYSACGLALRAVLRTFTSRREDVANPKKVRPRGRGARALQKNKSRITEAHLG